MSASLDPALVSWAEWGAQHLSANLGRVVAWEKLILIREAEGYRRHHVHTDPAVATMILTFSGADHEGTWVAPNGSVKTGSPLLWFTHLLARRASRNFRHWNGEFVRRQDLVQVDSGNEVLFVLGHLARNVLGPDAPVGFHTAPFEPRRKERYVGAFTYEFE